MKHPKVLAQNESKDWYPGIEIPVMENGKNLVRVYNRPIYTKSLNYFIVSTFPADQVFQYYDRHFQQRGWNFSNKQFKSVWQTFTEGTPKGPKAVKQRLSMWIHPDLNLEAFLALRYENQKKDPQELHVICQLQPNVDDSQLEGFFERMKKSPFENYQNFFELQKSFTKKTGELDLYEYEIAMNKHPELKQFLIEYKKIYDDLIMQTKKILDSL